MTLLEPCCLYDHVFSEHVDDVNGHSHACPVCVIFYGFSAGPNPGSLLTHLQSTHPEMEGASVSAAVQNRPDEEADFDLNSDAVGSRFARLVLRESDAQMLGTDQECPICLVEFARGQAVVRMDCWCLFHDDCVSAWFDKKGDCRCPTHIDE